MFMTVKGMQIYDFMWFLLSLTNKNLTMQFSSETKSSPENVYVPVYKYLTWNNVRDKIKMYCIAPFRNITIILKTIKM